MGKVFEMAKEKHRIFLRGNQKNRGNKFPGKKYTNMKTEKDDLQKKVAVRISRQAKP